MIARPSTADVALSVTVFAAAWAYLHLLWPNRLYGPDEGFFLFGAKRIVDGDVIYRDFFEFQGPVASYTLALMFALFGATMETARGSAAVLHGLIVALVYAILRRLGVRPAIAAAVSLTHIALFYPALPHTSPHWLSTAFTLTVFVLVLRAPLTCTRQVVGVGLLSGVLLLTQQPKGAATAVAVAIVIMRDLWLTQRRSALAHAVIRQLSCYAIGVLAVVVPTLLACVAVAGFEPLFDGLVRTPLIGYRAFPFHKQGFWLPLGLPLAMWRRLIGELSPMLLVNLMPLVIPVSAARLMWQAVKGARADDRRPLFVAVVFSALAIVSVYYQPNYSHFAVVGAIWLSVIGESLERFVRLCERVVRTPLVGAFAAVGVLILLVFQSRRALADESSAARVRFDTPFGRMLFRSQSAVNDAEALRTLLQAEHAKEIFVYPVGAWLYLVTETSAATRFLFLIPGLNSVEHFAEVQAALERKRVPFVVRTFWWWGQGDPLAAYLNEHYEGVKLPRKPSAFPSFTVLRRKMPGAHERHR